MFINLSNHPSLLWGEKQLEEAAEYGYIIDLPFPEVDPECGSEIIEDLAEEYGEKINELRLSECRDKLVVHIMGELTLCFALVSRLQSSGIRCLSSTTTRQTADNDDGSKTSWFEFVRFREYGTIDSSVH